ncbi:hypothetical protein OG285_05950 [Streptomyces sp. NBC_01471]|uniref:hypothetical protein n=1 Tax=Streptomyces sp. NBC_01471 TaxID=2903879 RepID=UPI00324B2325
MSSHQGLEPSQSNSALTLCDGSPRSVPEASTREQSHQCLGVGAEAVDFVDGDEDALFPAGQAVSNAGKEVAELLDQSREVGRIVEMNVACDPSRVIIWAVLLERVLVVV